MKQRPVRKLLALVLSLLLVLAFTPAAFAEGEDATNPNPVEEFNPTKVEEVPAPAAAEVAQIGDIKYLTLQDAVTNAKDGDEIKLLTDTEAFGVGIEKQLTLNLNGHTLSAASTTATPPNAILVIKGAGDLTITGTGTITNTQNVLNYHALLVGDGGNLTIDSGVTVSLPGNSPANSQCCVLIRDANSTLNTSGTLINKGFFAISGNGTYEGPTTVNVMGGRIEALIGIYQPQAGEINISNGTIESGDCVVMRSGTLNVTGGELIATGTRETDDNILNGGPETSGSAIFLDASQSYVGNMNVNLSGGSIRSTNGEAVCVNSDVTASIPTINVTDSAKLQSGSGEDDFRIAKDTEKSQFDVGVTGGSFSKPINSEYLASDTISIKAGVTYYAGQAAQNVLTNATASSGEIEVLTGTNLINVGEGVQIKNSTGAEIVVNGQIIKNGESGTAPAMPEPSKPSSSFTEPEYYPDYDEDVDYLPPVEDDEEEEEKAPLYMVTCRTLNVRMGPGTSYAKLGTLSRGTLISGEYENGWVKFTYNGQTAYSSADYLMQVDGDLSGLHVTCRTLNVRAGAGTNFDILGTLSRGTEISVRDVLPGWYEIDFLGGIGYVSSAYIG